MKPSVKVGIGLAGIFILNLLFRIPGFFQELPPYQFCDEDLFLMRAFDMFTKNDWSIAYFHSGGINFYLAIGAAKVFSWLTNSIPDALSFRIIARVFAPGILASSSVFFLFGAARRLAGSASAGIAAALLFSLSPMVVGTSRIYYPDHYIVCFASAFVFFIARIVSRSADSPIRNEAIDFLLAGLCIGLAASVKYTGVVLAGVIGVLSVVRILACLRSHSPRAEIRNQLLMPILAALAAVFAFLITNTEIFPHWSEFLAALRVDHYKPSESAFHGWIFYLEILLFASFGVMGALLYIAGSLTLARREPLHLIILVLAPMALVLLLGRYQLLFYRNMMLGIPFVFVLGGVGAEALRQRFAGRRVWGAILLAAVSIEPVGKLAYALHKDFLSDSRLQAKAWIEQTQSGQAAGQEARVLANWGCWYPAPVAVTRPPSGCYDFLVLDTWFGGLRQDGTIKAEDQTLARILAEPDYKNLHHLDQYGVWQLGPVRDYLLSAYKPVMEFAGYGPKVFAYHREDCAKK